MESWWVTWLGGGRTSGLEGQCLDLCYPCLTLLLWCSMVLRDTDNRSVSWTGGCPKIAIWIGQVGKMMNNWYNTYKASSTPIRDSDGRDSWQVPSKTGNIQKPRLIHASSIYIYMKSIATSSMFKATSRYLSKLPWPHNDPAKKAPCKHNHPNNGRHFRFRTLICLDLIIYIYNTWGALGNDPTSTQFLNTSPTTYHPRLIIQAHS